MLRLMDVVHHLDVHDPDKKKLLIQAGMRK